MNKLEDEKLLAGGTACLNAFFGGSGVSGIPIPATSSLDHTFSMEVSVGRKVQRQNRPPVATPRNTSTKSAFSPMALGTLAAVSSGGLVAFSKYAKAVPKAIAQEPSGVEDAGAQPADHPSKCVSLGCKCFNIFGSRTCQLTFDPSKKKGFADQFGDYWEVAADQDKVACCLWTTTACLACSFLTWKTVEAIIGCVSVGAQYATTENQGSETDSSNATSWNDTYSSNDTVVVDQPQAAKEAAEAAAKELAKKSCEKCKEMIISSEVMHERPPLGCWPNESKTQGGNLWSTNSDGNGGYVWKKEKGDFVSETNTGNHLTSLGQTWFDQKCSEFVGKIGEKIADLNEEQREELKAQIEKAVQEEAKKKMCDTCQDNINSNVYPGYKCFGGFGEQRKSGAMHVRIKNNIWLFQLVWDKIINEAGRRLFRQHCGGR